MSGVEGVIRGGGYLALANAVIAASGAAFWALMAAIIGPGGVGYLSAIMSTAGVIALASSLGINLGILRLMPVYGWPAYRDGLAIVALSSAAVGLLASIAVGLGLFQGGLKGFIPAIAVMGVLAAVGGASLYGVVAAGREELLLALQVLGQSLRLLLGVGGALAGGVQGAVAGLIVAGIATTATAYYATRRVAPEGRGWEGSMARLVLSVGLSAYPGMVAVNVALWAAILATAALTGSPEVTGRFYVALMISLTAASIPMSAALSYLPRASSGEAGQVAPIARVSLSLAALAVSALVASPGLVLGVLGEEFRGAWRELVVLASASPVVAGFTLSASHLLASSRYRDLLVAGAARLVMLVALSAVLAGPLGGLGVAVAFGASTLASLPLLGVRYVAGASLRTALMASLPAIASRALASAAGLPEAYSLPLALLATSALLLYTGYLTPRDLALIARVALAEARSIARAVLRASRAGKGQ